MRNEGKYLRFGTLKSRLTLTEFILAFHLIVARKNNIQLPLILPKRLYESGHYYIQIIF